MIRAGKERDVAAATLGLVTIGQSPRPDICRTYAAVIGADVRIVEAGALDGLTARAIDALAPEQRDTPLVTLAHGEEVRIGKAAITPLLQRAITRVVADGASVVIVLCTGHFEGLTAPVPLIEPDRVLDGFMRAIQPSGSLGIVMPDAGQEGMMRQKWHGYDLTLAVASPYQPPTEWSVLIARFVSAGVEAIVLDCMGFDPAAKAFFAEHAHLPVLCAQTATAHLVRDMLWEPSLMLA
jgi:protein AroM